ncbi:MAG: SUMF1/EgtB/PvdO family nonheme iron enzyme [Polyangiaceae bacterium]
MRVRPLHTLRAFAACGVAALSSVTLAASCDSVAPPRPQLLVVVDTDLPTVSQTAVDERLSSDAGIDAVRIDVYRMDGSTIDSLVVIAPSPENWPVSFGVATEDARVLVQARVFRVALADGSDSTLTPARSLTVDRVAELQLPEEGITVARMTLTGDCLGAPPSFVEPRTTCIDKSRVAAPIDEGLTLGTAAEETPTAVGRWPGAWEIPCAGEPREGKTCIPGGFSLLGEQGLIGTADGYNYTEDPVPLRPVLLSPFWVDTTEYTVKQFRSALTSEPGLVASDEYRIRDEGNTLADACTFTETAESDALPMSCIAFAAAERVCEHDGGTLPTEAQWEHAARGRGQHRPYTWGDSSPDCCHGIYAGCAPELQEPGQGNCDGTGDITRDGVLDMNGNAQEMTRDDHAAYDAPCWTQIGILHDPLCVDPTINTISWRGAGLSVPPSYAHLALRRQGLRAPIEGIGFRCVYADSAP